MEDKIIRNNEFTSIEELKKAEEYYKQALYVTKEEMEIAQKPSLVYALYTLHLLYAFRDRVEQIDNDIKDIEQKLNSCKSDKFDAKRIKENLSNYKDILNPIKKEAEENYLFYRTYLAKTAKKADTLNDITVNNVYIKTSEEVVKIQINNYLKYEKSFLLIKENLNKIKINF